MENENNIQLLKHRDFGLIFSDTFEFLKENWKPLLKGLLYIACPFFLVGGMMMGFGMDALYNIDIRNPDSFEDPPVDLENIPIFIIGYFLLIGLFVVGYIMSLLVVNSYMRLYREGHTAESIQTADIWNEGKQHFWKILGTSIVVMTMMMFGFILCFFPGIYIMVPLSLIFIMRIEESELTLGESIQKCFELVRNHWWQSLGVVIALSFIGSMLSYAFMIPCYILIYADMLLDLNDFGILQALGYGINFMASMLISGMMLCGTAIMYYSYRERMDGTGMAQQIETIGENTDYLPDSEGEY